MTDTTTTARDPHLDTFDGTLTVDPRPGGVTLVAPDALGLLAIEVAVLGVHAQSVRRARTFTVDGVAIGEFELEPERGREPDWDKVAADLRAALVDAASIREQLAARSARYGTFTRPTAARPADPRVFVDNDATGAATLVEVRAADGIGVLARITDAIAGPAGAGRAGVRVDPRPRGGRHLLRDRARRDEADRSGRRDRTRGPRCSTP